MVNKIKTVIKRKEDCYSSQIKVVSEIAKTKQSHIAIKAV